MGATRHTTTSAAAVLARSRHTRLDRRRARAVRRVRVAALAVLPVAVAADLLATRLLG